MGKTNPFLSFQQLLDILNKQHTTHYTEDMCNFVIKF